MQRLSTGFLLLAVFCGLLDPASLSAGVPFRIQVVDEQTGRGVPLVELQTVNNVRYDTDSQGVAAIDEPAPMGLDDFSTSRVMATSIPKTGSATGARP